MKHRITKQAKQFFRLFNNRSRQFTAASVVPLFFWLVLLTLASTGRVQATESYWPTAPSNLLASPASASQINLTWLDNSAIEAGYGIERAPTSSGPWAQIAATGANVTSYSSTGLAAATTYYYRVRAYSVQGYSTYYSAYCPIVAATTTSSSSGSCSYLLSSTSASSSSSGA